MKKRILLIGLGIISTTTINAQIGIGTSTPNSSAILDIESTTKGFLPPRLTYQNIVTISSPEPGLTMYCSNCCNTGAGLLTFYTSDGWYFLGENECDFIDTDRDLVVNDIDLDDDNDGILDTEESPTVLITEETNGTFGTTSTPIDVEGSIPNYTFAPSNTGEGQYAVVSDAINPNWHPANVWAYVGHTDGSSTDAFLAVNGGTSVGIFFQQTIPMVPGAEYRIAFWHRGDTYNLNVDVIRESNSSTVASSSTGLVTNSGWTELAFTYTNPLSEVELFKIELTNLSITLGGNDFAIDDVSITPTDVNTNLSDYDLDGYNNSVDLDSDGDGIPDNVEYQTTAGYVVPGTAVDALGRLIAYGTGGLTTAVNTDGDNLLDFIDTDSDGDATLDKDESGLTLTGQDTDRDGLDDGADDDVPGHTDVNGKAINSSDVNILTGGVEKDYRL